jgi:hypothetical protein
VNEMSSDPPGEGDSAEQTTPEDSLGAFGSAMREATSPSDWGGTSTGTGSDASWGGGTEGGEYTWGW